jgi:hypothetical protein
LQGKEKRPAELVAGNNDFWASKAASHPTAVLQVTQGVAPNGCRLSVQ